MLLLISAVMVNHWPTNNFQRKEDITPTYRWQTLITASMSHFIDCQDNLQLQTRTCPAWIRINEGPLRPFYQEMQVVEVSHVWCPVVNHNHLTVVPTFYESVCLLQSPQRSSNFPWHGYQPVLHSLLLIRLWRSALLLSNAAKILQGSLPTPEHQTNATPKATSRTGYETV